MGASVEKGGRVVNRDPWEVKQPLQKTSKSCPGTVDALGEDSKHAFGRWQVMRMKRQAGLACLTAELTVRIQQRGRLVMLLCFFFLTFHLENDFRLKKLQKQYKNSYIPFT